MPTGLRSCFAALCIQTMLSAVGRGAWAAEGPPGAEAAEQAPLIVLGGSTPAIAGRLKETLRESLRRAGIAVTVAEVARVDPRQVADAPPAGAAPPVRVWLDLSAARSATLYVTSGDRVFVRRLQFEGPFDSVALELVDLVVTSSIQSVLSGQHTGVSREEFRRSLDEAAETAAPPPAPEEKTSTPVVSPPAVAAASAVRSPPPPAPQAVRWAVATFYEGTLLASNRGMHGPGVLLHAERGAVRVGLGFHGRLPYEATGGGATVRVAAEGLRLSVAMGSFVRPRLLAIASLGAGADLTHVRTSVTEPGDLIPQPARWTVDPVVRPSLELERRWGRWHASVSAGVDVDLVGGRYVIADAAAAGATRPVWTPWRWRPYAALAVGLAL